MSNAAFAMNTRSNIQYSGNGLVMGEMGGVSIAIWRRKPNQELFDIQKRCLAEVVAKNKGKAAFVCVVEPSSEPPDDDIRKAASKMITDHDKNLRCLALVIEGTGFRSAITRTVLSGMLLLIRTPSPIKFFDIPKSACVWVSTLVPTQRDALVEEIETLRGLLDSH